MKSAIVKRSVVLDGHKTSVSLEDEFWEGLRQIAARRKTNMSSLVREIDRERGTANLSSAIRVFVFNQFRTSPAATGTGAGTAAMAPATEYRMPA